MKRTTLTLLSCLGFLVFGGSANAGQTYASCSLVDVGSFNNRVHLHCTKPLSACELAAGGCKQQQAQPPTYVAVESNSAMAQSVVQIGLAALANKHALEIFFDDNAGANPAGCIANDCRRLLGVVIH